jgi:hypothetical protein
MFRLCDLTVNGCLIPITDPLGCKTFFNFNKTGEITPLLSKERLIFKNKIIFQRFLTCGQWRREGVPDP